MKSTRFTLPRRAPILLGLLPAIYSLAAPAAMAAQHLHASDLVSEQSLPYWQAHAPGCSAEQIRAKLASVHVLNGNASTLAEASARALGGQPCDAARAGSRNLAALVATPVDLTSAVAAQITASGENGSAEGRTKLFDNSAGSKWLTFASTGWVAYDLGVGKKALLSSYSLTSANDVAGRDPLDWQIQGSNDGANWSNLTQQSGQLFASRGLRKAYNFSHATAYRYFRLNISRNNGAPYTQLAELELIGVLDAGTPPDSGVLSNGVPVSVSDVIGGLKRFRFDVPAGSQALSFKLSGGSGDADLYVKAGAEPSETVYDCKSDGSTNAESCSFATVGAGSYYALLKGYAAYSGASLVATATTGGSGDWVSVTSPSLDYRNDNSPGGQQFKALVPDPTTYVREIAQGVAKTLYKSPSEVPAFSTLELRIERWENDPNGVAWKAGDPPRITVNVNAYHLERIKAAGGNVAEEVKGVLFHEMTHAYQHYTGVELPAIEGLADTVRYLNGYIPVKNRRAGGSWTSSYQTTAFFFAWIKEQKGFTDFVYCANQIAKPGNTGWTWDKLTQTCAGGARVSPLWNEYQAWLGTAPR